MELPKIDLKYLKEAFKEPINFWGMAGFAVAAAYVQDITPLVAALATETLYLATVPATSVYRRLVDRRLGAASRVPRDSACRVRQRREGRASRRVDLHDRQGKPRGALRAAADRGTGRAVGG